MYTFSKKVTLDEFESKPRKTMVSMHSYGDVKRPYSICCPQLNLHVYVLSPQRVSVQCLISMLSTMTATLQLSSEYI